MAGCSGQTTHRVWNQVAPLVVKDTPSVVDLANLCSTVCVFWLFTVVFLTSVYLYFPHHVRYVCGRARYYLSGRELDVPAALKWSASYLNPWGNLSNPLAYAVRAVSLGDEL